MNPITHSTIINHKQPEPLDFDSEGIGDGVDGVDVDVGIGG